MTRYEIRGGDELQEFSLTFAQTKIKNVEHRMLNNEELIPLAFHVFNLTTFPFSNLPT